VWELLQGVGGRTGGTADDSFDHFLRVSLATRRIG
jgi:hypothetical protein